MSPNLRPNIFWLKVRTRISQPSICVPTFTQFTSVRSGRPPGHGRLAEAFSSLWPDHSSRKDGVACVPEAAKPSPFGKGQGDIRLSGIYPLLGQDTPWILGHQAEDGRETPAPVYERDMDMVSRESPCATPGAVSGLVRETARPLPILWYPWQLQDARSGLRVYRASLAILAEQTQPQGPPKLAEV